MRSDLRNYWHHPGYWRWVWRARVTNPSYLRWLWQTRLSGDTKGALVLLVAVSCAIAGYLSADWLGPRQESATVTTQRVVTVVRTMRTPAVPQVTTSQTPAQPAEVRINVLSVIPPRPQAARRFEVVARVSFAPVVGSIRCGVWVAGEQYRNIRLTWNSPIARCFFRVPDGTRGKLLLIRLSATLGRSGARMTLPFTVS
jgi:hypothetical protein